MNNNTINTNTWLIGTDPEAFLRRRDTLEIISAIGLIPGSKEEPYNLEHVLGKGFFIQTDNVMVEWCVPATNNPKELHSSIKKCIEYTNSIIPAELEVVVQASAFLDKKYLRNKEARTFGCDPSFNAWTYMQNTAPDNKTNLRTAGGHIHIGYDNPNEATSINIIRVLDLFLGIPSLILDSDTERKKMYGQAGEFRFKNYGVEYRGLSNYWINSPDLIKFVFKGVDRAIDFINQNGEFSDVDQFMIQDCINKNNKIEAHKLIQKYHLDDVLETVYIID